MPKRGHIPQRRCVGCYNSVDKGTLLRIVLHDGVLCIDESGRMAGRAAYLCRDRRCLQIAAKKRAMQRSLGVSIAAAHIDALIGSLLERCEDAGTGKEVIPDGEDQGP